VESNRIVQPDGDPESGVVRFLRFLRCGEGETAASRPRCSVIG
jgi:hypothetical protein